MDSSKTLVIYHGGSCTDGFTAAWVAREHLGDSAEYVPAMYGSNGERPSLPDVEGRDVLFVDFCPPREQLLEVKERARSVQVLDHHKTAAEACGDLPFCRFDMERSGAGLTWDTLVLVYGGPSERPWLVNYVEDRDLWRFALPNSKAVNAWIGTIDKTWENFDALAALSLESCAQRGEAVLAFTDRYVALVSQQARRVSALGFASIPVVNAPYMMASELAGHLAESAAFAIAWFERADGQYQYSLRSRGEHGADVSELAKKRGGGGHRNASGFTSRFPPQIALGDVEHVEFCPVCLSTNSAGGGCMSCGSGPTLLLPLWAVSEIRESGGRRKQ